MQVATDLYAKYLKINGEVGIDRTKAEIIVWAKDDQTIPFGDDLIVGLDLGTSNSCMAVWHLDKSRVKIFKTKNGFKTMPSVLSWDIGDEPKGKLPQSSLYTYSFLFGEYPVFFFDNPFHVDPFDSKSEKPRHVGRDAIERSPEGCTIRCIKRIIGQVKLILSYIR